MQEDPKITICYAIAFVACILLAIAITSGTFGGQSDIDVFRAYVEGGSK